MTKLFKWPDLFNKRVTKSFEQFDVSVNGSPSHSNGVDVSNEWVKKPFKQVDVSSKRVAKPFEQLTNSL